jgi:hypothetical protein
VIVVSTLAGLKFVFDSYFTSVAETYVQEQVLDSAEAVAERDRIRQDWEAQLQTPPTIDDAMRQLARGGRGGVALVAPTPSTDTAALTGWQHRRTSDNATRPLAYAAPAPPAPVPAVAPGPAPATPGDPTPMPNPEVPPREVGEPSAEGGTAVP